MTPAYMVGVAARLVILRSRGWRLWGSGRERGAITEKHGTARSVASFRRGTRAWYSARPRRAGGLRVEERHVGTRPR